MEDFYDKIYVVFNEAKDGWIASLAREKEWNSKTGFFSSTSTLEEGFENGLHKYKELEILQKLLPQFSPYPEQYRTRLLKTLISTIEENNSDDASEELEDSIEEVKMQLNKAKQFCDFLKESRAKIIRSFHDSCVQCRELVDRHISSLHNIETDEDKDVFSAINLSSG